MNMKDVLRRIKERMTELNIPSARQLGIKSGLTPSIIHTVFTGESPDLRFETALRIANALQCDVTWLMTGNSVTSEKVVAKNAAPDEFSEWCAIPRIQIEYDGKGFSYTKLQAPPMWYKKEWFDDRCMNPDTCFITRMYGAKIEHNIQFWSGDELLIDVNPLAQKPTYNSLMLGVFVCGDGRCIPSVYDAKAFLANDPAVKDIHIIGAVCLRNSRHLC